MATTPLLRQRALGYALLLSSWLWHALFAAAFVFLSVWSLKGAFHTFDDKFRTLPNTKAQAVVMSIFFLAYTFFHIAAVFPNFSWITAREVDVEQASGRVQTKARVYGVAKEAGHLWLDRFRANGDGDNIPYCIAAMVVVVIESVESFLGAAIFWIPKILQTA
ncbi:hypothetical protein CCMA1212_008147 [Trichoderma ghanense]|uniref:Uncharacterized protein n=1 Tax=Trichoderma ghanense TaxID=65468 RepID=A0ABY2GWR3_9HYPO